MSAGSRLQYNLRLKKTIERNIFISLLHHVSHAVSPNSIVYISMGGPYLQDQAEIHANLGWKDLLSFDSDEWVVKRQHFNKPVSYIRCFCMTSDELVMQLDDFLLKHVNHKNCVFWLDFTDGKSRGEQLRQARAIIPSLKHGDVLKITLNAQISGLGQPPSGILHKPFWRQELKNQLTDYFPATTSDDDMTATNFPSILGQAFSIACSGALTGSGMEFAPLSAFQYADGAQMATFSGAVVESQKKDAFLEKIKGFEFLINDFSDIREINVPELSLREKTEIDRLVFGAEPDVIRTKLGLSLDALEAKTDEMIRQYKSYYRFYPKFARISAV